MSYDMLVTFYLDPDRLHGTTTVRTPITRVYIDMLAPQTLRAVVSVAVTHHLDTAVLADKIFFISFKHVTRILS
jgi:hypothetical protein